MALELHLQTGETQAWHHTTPATLPDKLSQSLLLLLPLLCCLRYLSPEDSTEMCTANAQNRATTGSLLWHLWFEEQVQWPWSCTFRPERRKHGTVQLLLHYQTSSHKACCSSCHSYAAFAICHLRIQRRCARRMHRTVRPQAVFFGISGLKNKCNGPGAAPSDRRDASMAPYNSRYTTKQPLTKLAAPLATPMLPSLSMT